MCDFEMDTATRDRYIGFGSRANKTYPEGWTSQMCREHHDDLVHMLCSDGISDDKFVTISSCQCEWRLVRTFLRAVKLAKRAEHVVRQSVAPEVAVYPQWKC